MKTATFRAIIEQDEEGFHGYVPALPGCHTWGATIDETRENLREAIEEILLSMEEHGDPIPVDTTIETLETVALPSSPQHASYA